MLPPIAKPVHLEAIRRKLQLRRSFAPLPHPLSRWERGFFYANQTCREPGLDFPLSESLHRCRDIRNDMRKYRWSGANARNKPNREAASAWMNYRVAEPRSFFNCLNATSFEVLKMIAHFLELVGRVTLPFRNLADDANRITGTV